MKTLQAYALCALRVIFILFFFFFQFNTQAQSLGEPFNISVPPDKNSVNFGKSDIDIPTFRQMLGVNVKVFDLEANALGKSYLGELNGTSISGDSQKVLDIFSHFRVFYPCNRDYWQYGNAPDPYTKEGQIPKYNMSKLKLLVDSFGIPVDVGSVGGAEIIYPVKGVNN